jgi:hypothetical protein
VTPIRTATGSALKPIKVGRLPDSLAITPDGADRLRGQLHLRRRPGNCDTYPELPRPRTRDSRLERRTAAVPHEGMVGTNCAPDGWLGLVLDYCPQMLRLRGDFRASLRGGDSPSVDSSSYAGLIMIGPSSRMTNGPRKRTFVPQMMPGMCVRP